MVAQEDIIVGLDIGTTKICAVVGERQGNMINIIGTGTHPSIGLKKGVVIDIESTVDSIKKAVEEAELMAGCEITSVYAGIAGGHIMGFNSHGIIAIKGREVTQSDVDRVIEAARAVAIPMDREVIHVLPQEFIVDDQRGIQNPIGMAGVRLEANIHIVTGAVASAHNIIKCANKAGLDVADVRRIVEQAVAYANELRGVISEVRFTWSGRVFTLDASVGIAMLNHVDGNIDEALSTILNTTICRALAHFDFALETGEDRVCCEIGRAMLNQYETILTARGRAT